MTEAELHSGAATTCHAAIFRFESIQHSFAGLIGEATGAAFLEQAAEFKLPLPLAVVDQGSTS